MSDQPTRCLIVPCETRSREFDAKLLLGLLAAGRGIEAYVGAKKRIDAQLDRLPAGVYIGKGLTDRARISLRLARLCGHRLALWDEEGLVWSSPEVYWGTKVHGPNLALPDLMLAWGEANARVWRDHPDWPGTPLATVGNPRIDLLRPQLRRLYQAEAEALKEQHGNFVLINTNFSRVNNYQPRQNRHLKWLRENRPDQPRGGFARHKLALFQSFQAMLPELCRARPGQRFVLRPHPSEAIATWQALAEGLPNLVIERRGGIVPWLMAADAIIHNGCTTAIEAWLLGCPALAWQPLACDRYDHPLPNGISLACTDLATLLDAVDQSSQDRTGLFARQANDPERQGLLAVHLAGLDAPGLDSERILDQLDGLLKSPARRALRAGPVMALKRLVASTARWIPGTPNYGPYLDHMFPPTPLSEVRARTEQMAATLGLRRSPRVSEIDTSVFCLKPA
jgi:surface carbohydrate biosynthesis protein